jgi:hypothetical protein
MAFLITLLISLPFISHESSHAASTKTASSSFSSSVDTSRVKALGHLRDLDTDYRGTLRVEHARFVSESLATTAPLSPRQLALIPQPWRCITVGESRGIDEVTGDEWEGGYLQMSIYAWTHAGGTGVPATHTFWQQLQVAVRWLQMTNWGQWQTAGACGV